MRNISGWQDVTRESNRDAGGFFLLLVAADKPRGRSLLPIGIGKYGFRSILSVATDKPGGHSLLPIGIGKQGVIPSLYVKAGKTICK